MTVSRTIAAGKNALRLKINLLPVMFLTSAKLLSLKLQKKYPGFRVHGKALAYTWLIAAVHPSPANRLAQRALHLPKASMDWDFRLHFFMDFVIVFPTFGSIL